MEKNTKIKFLILILPIIVFVFSYGGINATVWELILSSLSFIPNILVLSFVLFYNTIDIIKYINSNYLYLCRMKNINNYYKLIISECIKSNIKIIIIFMLLNISGSFIASTGNLSIPDNPYYSFSILILVAYYEIKYIAIFSILSIMVIYCYNFFRKIGAYIYLTIILACSFSSYMVSSNPKPIESILEFPILFPEYITVQEYSTFVLDILAFALYCSILFLILSFLKFLCIKHRGDIQDETAN